MNVGDNPHMRQIYKSNKSFKNRNLRGSLCYTKGGGCMERAAGGGSRGRYYRNV